MYNNCLLFYYNQYSFHRYAFVLHRTALNAEYNLKRPIDRFIFGSNCHVEYANSRFYRFSEHQTTNTWSIIVRKIPENITEEYLRNLFIGCHSMKYAPARAINKTKRTVTSNTKNKLLWG